MRTLILRQPPPTAAESLPPSFAVGVDEPALREWLAHPSARRLVVPVSPGAGFDETIASALGLAGAPADSIAVVYLPAHTLVDPEDAASLDLEAAFARTAEANDNRVEQIIEEAETLFDEDDWDGAERLFRRAEVLLNHESSARRAEVLAGLGEISRLQARAREATVLFDQALSMCPTQPVALRGRATLARSTGDHAIAAALLYRLAAAEQNRQEQTELLSDVASESLEAARQAITRALELRPGDRGLLERLRAAHEAAGLWEGAVSVSVQLAEDIADPRARARALVAAADMCAQQAKKPGRAVALYEAAIADDAQVTGAFEAIETTLLGADDHAGVARAYERQIERLPEEAATERAELLRRLAMTYRDKLGDTHQAMQALDRITREEPGNVGARLDLADLLHKIGETTLAMRCLEVAAQHDPLAAPVYRRLFHLFSKQGDVDRAYSASAALVALGEATSDEQLAYAEHAPHSPLTFSHPFDDDVWTELLPNAAVGDIEHLFAALEDAAIDAWLARREADGPLSLPSREGRQDPATTTVSAVRSFGWASRLLGVPEPTIYAAPDNVRISAATLPARAPTVLLGRSLLTGRSPIELVFIAARHMAYFRPGRRVLAYYPTSEDLDALLRAAVSIARPDLVPQAALNPVSAELCVRLDHSLGAAQRPVLRDALGKLWAEGGVVDLAGWARDVEAAACRAALLATGDVTVARTLLAVSGGPAAGMSAADRARDLLGFSVTQRYAALRRMLGIRLA